MSKKRKAGQGTLRKRSDGRWEGRIVIGYNEKGLPITKGVTASEKGKCIEKRNTRSVIAPGKLLQNRVKSYKMRRPRWTFVQPGQL